MKLLSVILFCLALFAIADYADSGPIRDHRQHHLDRKHKHLARVQNRVDHRSSTRFAARAVRLAGHADRQAMMSAPSSASVRDDSAKPLSQQICIPMRPTGVSKAWSWSPAR